jgi:hypothetical protein
VSRSDTGGQMVEAWHLEDIAGLLRQVGALPSYFDLKKSRRVEG